MKLSELKYAIREMIVSELMEVDTDKTRGTVVLPKTSNPTDVKKLTDQGLDVELKEEQLDEMATFYKVKPEVEDEAKVAIEKVQSKFREGSAQYNT